MITDNNEQKMKAVVLYEPKDVRVTEDFPVPTLAENAVKIAVEYCGLCGTDFHKYQGKAGARPVTYPVALGHEASGIVEQVGSAVTGVKPGDRVTVDPNWSCGHCYYCKNGKRHLCENSKGVVKGMAQYICPPEENVYRLPDGLSLLDAALCEPLSCCLHGIDLLNLREGESVAIVGFGAIGNLMLQLCRNAGASHIIVVETDETKRETAMKLGATLFLNPKTDDLKTEIEKAEIKCVDKVIECVGLPVTAETALNIAGKGATVVLFGVMSEDAVIPFKAYEAFRKELVIKMSYINPATTDRAIALLAKGQIDTEAAIGKIIEPEELSEELETRKYSKLGKVIVHIGKSE